MLDSPEFLGRPFEPFSCDNEHKFGAERRSVSLRRLLGTIVAVVLTFALFWFLAQMTPQKDLLAFVLNASPSLSGLVPTLDFAPLSTPTP